MSDLCWQYGVSSNYHMPLKCLDKHLDRTKREPEAPNPCQREYSTSHL